MGKPRYTLILEKQPKAEDEALIYDRLAAFNREAADDDQHTPLILFVRANDGTIMGGLVGSTFWGWLHVDVLWLDESLRGQHFGSDLLAAAEREALKRGCHSAFVDTMSWQALPFYEKQGYVVFGELDDFPVGHKRYYLKKRLVS
ncbi:MAG: GNAT family N-acetyltransferase [Anaerolineae bacterium]|nr:GNAT family N-acetyltransferase [Anaerolineae bacterium]